MKTVPTFCLRVRGHLDETWSEWLDGFTIVHEPNGESTLTGSVPDQAALYGLLTKARDLGLELVAVTLAPLSPEQAAPADDAREGRSDATPT